jgi:putative two-component system response regulator
MTVDDHPNSRRMQGTYQALRSDWKLPWGRGAKWRGSAQVLVVDDDGAIRRTLRRLLEAFGYSVREAEDGTKALTLLDDSLDLVLLDVQMPSLDGFGFLDILRNHPLYSDLPVIMVTGLGGREDRLHAVAAGANDFIVKPFEAAEVYLRAESQLQTKRASDRLKRHRQELEEEVEKRTQELRKALEGEREARSDLHDAHLDTIRRLVLAAEFKDLGTAGHIERIGDYCAALGRVLGVAPDEAQFLGPACSLHDIGKIGTPDAILLKPGPLTPDERTVMQEHTRVGARILGDATSPILRLGRTVAMSHHERWNGSGYPVGLKEREIPLVGRICAVADVFDALTSDRPYREALTNGEAVSYLQEVQGTDLDPEIVDAFLHILPEIEEIQRVHPRQPRVACPPEAGPLVH